MQDEWKGTAALVYRPSIYLRHEIAGSYSYIKMDEAVLAEFNPRYFRNGDNKHSALTLTYSFEYDDRDLRIYPTSGVKAGFEVQKIGWGNQDDENVLTSTISMEWNHSLSKRLLQRLSTLGRYSLSRSQPSYHHYEGLGNGQKFIRGYELYVIN
ncbi:MAG: BamA/TamA family outer membrane protein, partial [Burkholderiales bacterium]|nr:BamA/TamA family outer membrane protein [Burkholderiales bacterium]